MMNSLPGKAAASQPAVNPLAKMTPEDREFLPAAIEILETPPSPVKIWIGFAICTFAALAIAWSFVGRLDVYATAHGRLVTDVKPSVVQSLITGKVKLISVQNGSHVEKGQKLAELDPSEAEADTAASSAIVNSSQAEMARRGAAIALAKKIKAKLVDNQGAAPDYSDLDRATYDRPDVPAEIAAREQRNLEADLIQLQSDLLNLDQQMAQSQATKGKADASITADLTVIAAQQARMDVQHTALEKQVASKLAFYEAQENLARGKAQLVIDQGQKAEAQAAIAQLQGQKMKLIDGFIVDNQNKITEAARKADDAREQLAKARSHLSETTLIAPLSGTVEELALVSVGQVITSGQQAMVITPDDQPLSAQVYISNADIGFVHQGQEATLKIDAYPFTQYGSAQGQVVRIASDALSEQDALRLQTKPTSLGNSGAYSPTPSAPGQGENIVFPVTVSLADKTLRFHDRELPLKPGMTVEVEIKTDNRRIIDYLLSPISKISSEAMHER